MAHSRKSGKMRRRGLSDDLILQIKRYIDIQQSLMCLDGVAALQLSWRPWPYPYMIINKQCELRLILTFFDLNRITSNTILLNQTLTPQQLGFGIRYSNLHPPPIPVIDTDSLTT